MQILCLVTLICMNGAYLFISFNMESIVHSLDEEPTEELVITSSTENNFELADILDLDIFDFDVEELADDNRGSEFTAVNCRRTKDFVVI